MDLNKKNSRKIFGFIAFGIILFVAMENLGAVAGAAGRILGLFWPFLLGLCIAFILNIPMRLLEERVFAGLKGKKVWNKICRPVCMVLSIVIIVAIVFFVMFLVLPELVRTFTILSRSIPVFVTDVQNWLIKLAEDFDISADTIRNISIDWDKMISTAVTFLQDGATTVLNTTIGVTTSIVNGVVNFFLAVIFAIYILAAKEKLGGQIRKFLRAFIDPKKADQFLYVCSLSSRIFGNFVSGQCTEAVILGTLCWLGMLLLRLPYPLVIGALVGLTALIPIFGAFVGCAVGAFLILIVSPVKALIFIIFFLVLQQIEGNLIYPKVVGTSVGLPGIWVLLAVTIGGSMFGVIGMLIFVPLCSVLYCLFREAVHHRLRDKEQPTAGKAAPTKDPAAKK